MVCVSENILVLVLKACDELSGKKKVRKNGGNKWWWNEEVRNAMARKKEAFKTFCKTGFEEHKIFYRKMRNQTKKVIAKAMKTEAEKEIEELREKPNKVFKLVKLMKRNGKDIKGRKWIKGRDGRIGFSEEHQCKTWKEHMESIMIEENAWDQWRTHGGVPGFEPPLLELQNNIILLI